jgi:excisionase family DNA binding protein
MRTARAYLCLAYRTGCLPANQVNLYRLPSPIESSPANHYIPINFAIHPVDRTQYTTNSIENKRVTHYVYQERVYKNYSYPMRESLDLPNMPEYVPIKEAAKMLGVSDKRVYAYIEEGRLPAVRAAHVIMIPLQAVQQFKPKISGRPRKNTPNWRTSPQENLLLTTSIVVSIRPGQQKELEEHLERIRQEGEHLFPGSYARYIIKSEAHPGTVEFLLIWRSTMIPDEATRTQALHELQEELDDVLDWSGAWYDNGTILLHT